MPNWVILISISFINPIGTGSGHGLAFEDQAGGGAVDEQAPTRVGNAAFGGTKRSPANVGRASYDKLIDEGSGALLEAQQVVLLGRVRPRLNELPSTRRGHYLNISFVAPSPNEKPFAAGRFKAPDYFFHCQLPLAGPQPADMRDVFPTDCRGLAW
jgi:hypothetical protein